MSSQMVHCFNKDYSLSPSLNTYLNAEWLSWCWWRVIAYIHNCVCHKCLRTHNRHESDLYRLKPWCKCINKFAGKQNENCFKHTDNLKIIDARYQLPTVLSTSLLPENRWNHDNGRQLFWDWQSALYAWQHSWRQLWAGINVKSQTATVSVMYVCMHTEDMSKFMEVSTWINSYTAFRQTKRKLLQIYCLWLLYVCANIPDEQMAPVVDRHKCKVKLQLRLSVMQTFMTKELLGTNVCSCMYVYHVCLHAHSRHE